MLDRQLVETTADELGTRPGLIEKDWHVVRAIGVLAELDHGEVRPAFSGGTSLSTAWGLIKRFSEDMDFKVAMPPAANKSGARAQRRAYREKVLAALGAADFELIQPPHIRDRSNFFSADFAYDSQFDTGPGLRPELHPAELHQCRHLKIVGALDLHAEARGVCGDAGFRPVF